MIENAYLDLENTLPKLTGVVTCKIKMQEPLQLLTRQSGGPVPSPPAFPKLCTSKMDFHTQSCTQSWAIPRDFVWQPCSF